MINPRFIAFRVAIAVLLVSPSASLMAQGAGVPIELHYLTKNNAPLIAKARALKESGRLVLTSAKATSALAKPTRAKVTLTPASSLRLESSVIAEKGRKALIRVGWLCLCSHCDRWHVCLSGGYAITADGVVVTAYHCVSPEEQSMREGYLVAADTEGHVFPVTRVLAADKELDTAVLQVDATGLSPLAINDQSVPGDAAYVFSDPLSVPGYFSAGMVNRYYWDDKEAHPDPTTLAAARHLRVNVSTDWGPGSSGAAVLDSCGNAIGHVDVISPLGFDDDGGKAAPKAKSAVSATTDTESDEGTILVLHEAIPARGVKLLIEAMGKR